jgi:hypothetical protein
MVWGQLMYEVKKVHVLALKNNQSSQFRKIGDTWFARVSEGHLEPLSKVDGYLPEFLLMNNLLVLVSEFYEEYAATKDLLDLNVEVGFVFRNGHKFGGNRGQ